MTDSTYHDVQPYDVAEFGRSGFSARCLTHDVVTAETWPNFGQAGSGFVCDSGAGLRFVTEFHGDDLDVTPRMLDLSGLARAIRSDAESHAYGQDYGQTHVWQWRAGGTAERLTVTLARATAFDDNDYARQYWQVTGQDGRVICEVSVRIDGRA